MIITVIVVVVVLLIVICIYNSLVRQRNYVDNAFAQIDVQLKKRFDLIPNIVATVNQFAEHELKVFATVTELRNKAYEQMSGDEKAALDSQLQKAAINFRALAENYPDLKSSRSFEQLQRTLNETEEQLSAARRTFNAAVTNYNISIQTFPGNIFASMFGFTKRQLLSTPQDERKNVSVKGLFD